MTCKCEGRTYDLKSTDYILCDDCGCRKPSAKKATKVGKTWFTMGPKIKWPRGEEE